MLLFISSGKWFRPYDPTVDLNSVGQPKTVVMLGVSEVYGVWPKALEKYGVVITCSVDVWNDVP